MKSTIKCVLATALLLASITSCSDEALTNKKGNGGTITLKCKLWTNVSRSVSDDNENSYLKLTSTQLTNSSKWLITAEQQGIDNASLGEKQSVSRGEQITDDNFYSKFAVYAYLYSADYSDFATAADNNNASIFINGAVAQKGNNDTWTTSPQYSWQHDSDRITFYGIAPTTENYSNYTITSNVANPNIAYTVPAAVTNQPDVLLAEKTCLGDGSNDSNVLLNFNHILTAIKVKVSVSNLTDESFAKSVKTITITHVKNSGTYNLSSNNSWTLGDTYSDFTFDVPIDITTENNEYALADGENTFMMMPQSFTDNEDAAIKVTLSDGSTLTSSLKSSGVAWSKGNTITYYISNTRDKVDYIIDAPETIYFSWDKDSKDCLISSYKKITKTDGSTDVEKVFLDWSAIVTDATPNFVESPSDETPTTVTGHESYPQDSPADTLAISTLRIKDDLVKIYDSEDVATLQNTAVVGSENDYYDLSTNSTGTSATNRNTSNCYIVNAPGYYRIPLVYGNAIKGGNYNKGAYQTSSLSGYSFSGYYLSNFKEHRDYEIPDPWITYWKGYSGYKPKTAKVLWQDSKNIIKDSNIKVGNVSSNDDYIYFTIENDKTTLVPGNVVIVLYDDVSDPYVMWTWHIWVTPIKSSDTIEFKNAAGSTSTFLKYPLGYVNEPTHHYPERTAKLVITQKEGGYTTATHTVNLIQEEHDFKPISTPYYQFGRMVPFPGAICSEAGGLDKWESYQYEMVDKPCYDGAGNTYTMKLGNNTRQKIVSSVREPATFFDSSYLHWALNDETYYNLWGCTYSGNLSGSYKTVYDPCPPGFKVPPLNSFPQLTFDNDSHSSGIDEFSTTSTDEVNLFNNQLNTPFTNHLDYIDYFGFKFYLNNMSGEGNKGVTNETILFPALGYRIAAQGEVTGAAKVGQTRTIGGVHNMGGYFYYWSSSQKVVLGTNSNRETETYFVQGGYILGNCGAYPNSHTIWPARGMPVWPMVGE